MSKVHNALIADEVGRVTRERDAANLEIVNLNGVVELLYATEVPVITTRKHELDDKPLILISNGNFQIGQVLALLIDVGDGDPIGLGVVEIKGRTSDDLFKCELVYRKAIDIAADYIEDDTRYQNMVVRSEMSLKDLSDLLKV